MKNSNSFIVLMLIMFFLFTNNSSAQNNLIKDIKSSNEKGNFEKSKKTIFKYKEKYDTLDFNFKLALSDYYIIKDNPEYDLRKSHKLLFSINCQNLIDKNVYLKKDQDCNTFLELRKNDFMKSFFSIVEKSNNLDSLRYFISVSNDYPEFRNQINERLAGFIIDYYINEYNQGKNPKDDLILFINEFSKTSYVTKAQNYLEKIEYRNAENLNTKIAFLNFLNIYPNSTKRNEVLAKIENFSWKECDSLKTKTAYENFIKEYPNSTKVRTAKIALDNLVAEFNLEEINSYTSVSVGKNIFRPFTFISGKKVFPEMSITEISHNGKMAIGIGTKDSRIKNMTNNIANIIDLTDGKILFEYKYDEFSRYLFSDDDSKLYFYENKSVKSLDLKNFDIKTIFKIDIGFFDRANLYLSDNILHLTTMRNDYKEPVIHFSYNLNANKLDTETFYLPEYDGAGIETLKQFNSYLGTTEEKLLKLKLIQGDNIFIKPINKNSKNEYIVFRYPQLLIIKDGIITTNTNIQIFTTDKFTKEIKELNFFRSPYSFLSENNKIILSDSDRPNNNGFYILELGTKNGQIINSSVKTKFIDPIKFNASFIGINEKTDKIYFDIDIDGGCDYDNDFEISVQDYKDITNNDLLKETTHKILSENDKKLSEFLSTYINETNIRNMPIETDNEKYLRIKNLYVNNLPSFIKLQDSLTQNLNTILTDSIRIFDFKATDVFIASNYDLNNENWRLIFNNPYGGKNFSVIYNQSKLSAKKDLSNNFSDLKIQVKYYLNPLSYTYEPVLLTISNIQTNTQNKFIIPFKSLSLLKNLYLTDNSYVDNFMNSKYIDCRLERGDLTYDSDIIKYFVNNGKPKYYFNYGFNDYNRIVKVEGVSAFNLDDINFRYNLEKSENFESGYKFNSMGRGTNLKFNEIPYFINKSNQDGTAIFGTSSSSNSFEKNEFYTPGKFNYQKNWRISDDVIYSNEGKGVLSDLINITDLKNNKIVKQFNLIELGNLKDRVEKIDFDAVISPNGKYLAIRVNDMTFLFNTVDWKNIFKFKSNVGKLYWDCNSYFLGIGENVLPIQLIEKTLK